MTGRFIDIGEERLWPPFEPPFEPEEGDVIYRPHPFTRMIHRFPAIFDQPGYADQWWRPGAWDHDGYDNIAHGTGQVLFRVVCIAAPPGYPRRVLYTRQFIDPHGKPMKKSGLLCHAIGTFRQRIKPLRLGYIGPRIDGSRDPVERREGVVDA